MEAPVDARVHSRRPQWRALLDWALTHITFVLGILGVLFSKDYRESFFTGVIALGGVVLVAVGFAALTARLDQPLFHEQTPSLAIKALLAIVLVAVSLAAYALRSHLPSRFGLLEIGIGIGVTLHYVTNTHGSAIEALAAIFVVVDGIENFRHPRQHEANKPGASH